MSVTMILVTTCITIVPVHYFNLVHYYMQVVPHLLKQYINKKPSYH